MLWEALLSKWDKPNIQLKSDPIDIALWAESLAGPSHQMLKLQAGQPATPPAKTTSDVDETPSKKRKYSDKERVYCEFCRREVTTHSPANCYNNPANKPPAKEKN